VSASTHLKGFDFFSSTYYATGGDFLIAALSSAGIQVSHRPSHEAARSFPFHLSELQEYNVVILSDIGANTLLLPPDVFLEGRRVPNRLEVIKEYVLQGGGLVMAGGYLSFQGIYGCARYHRTPIEEVLPSPFCRSTTGSRNLRASIRASPGRIIQSHGASTAVGRIFSVLTM